jgi:spore coat polysaccharide biosynthesis protein SpsF
MSTVCIVQARMGSTRLPGKVMQPILDKPMLGWVMYRLRRSRLIDQAIIATTVEKQDDRLVEFCEQQGWLVYRGSQDDVLDRYYQTARQYQADHIVRVTSDCPLIDPAVMDYVIAGYLSAAPHPDYASNTLERTYPRGLDTEVFSLAALAMAWKADASPWREHVTPYLNQNPDRFRLQSVTNPENFSHLRWTVDTPEDLKLVRTVYEHFGHGNFSWQQVLEAFKEHPEWAAINQDVQQKSL